MKDLHTTPLTFQEERFCPRCGAQGSWKGRKFSCSQCTFVRYENPAAAGGVIFCFPQTGEVLMSRRGREPEKGKLDFPGGFVEIDETFEEAMRREMQEELCIDIDLHRLEYFTSITGHYVYGNRVTPVLDAYFLYRLQEEEYQHIRPRDDVAAILRVRPQEVREKDIAWKRIQVVLSLLLQRTYAHESSSKNDRV